MKKRTRIVAWIYLISNFTSFIAVLFFLLLAVLGAGIGLGLFEGSETYPAWVNSLLGLGVVSVSIIGIALYSLSLLPWIYLLRKRAWAWWVLTIYFFAETAVILWPLTDPSTISEILSGTLEIIVYIALLSISAGTLIILLSDYPSNWKRKKSPKRKTKIKYVYRQRRTKS